MNKFWFFLIGGVIFLIGIGAIFQYQRDRSLNVISPIVEKITEKPLDKYSFEKLQQTTPEKSEITLERVLKEEEGFTSHLFSFTAEGEKITGQLNVPVGEAPDGGWPVVLMVRGYIDPENYQTGDGTRNAAAVFARNGFVTIAPDFLGYGESDDPDENSITARVKNLYHVLVLLNSLDSIPYTLNPNHLFLWGHSNGGQIALSLLEITGRNLPTALWAPVSKPFPYSILYYTDNYDDRGKALRKVIADFEKDYDVELYSIDNYYADINAPLQIHQGTADDAVPQVWSDELVEKLENLDKEVTYFVYPGTDHNLQPSWDTVVQRNVAFFRSFME